MRFIAIAVIVVSLGGVGVIVYAQLQNMSKRTPILTTDDVAPRRPVAEGPESTTARAPLEPASGPLAWHYDLSRAKEIARSDNKLIIVDVYTDWCGWCKKMDQVIYNDPMIVGLSRQEVFVKLDAEDGGQGERFAREMNVRGFPTTIIIDGHGNKITEARGFIPTREKFIEFVESARSKKRA
jgi:thiol:disulfide interchange protein